MAKTEHTIPHKTTTRNFSLIKPFGMVFHDGMSPMYGDWLRLHLHTGHVIIPPSGNTPWPTLHKACCPCVDPDQEIAFTCGYAPGELSSLYYDSYNVFPKPADCCFPQQD